MIARRTFVLFGLAVAAGLLAAWLAHNWVQQTAVPAERASLPTKPVVVAAFDIDYGERLAASSLKTVAWPEESVPEGAITDESEVLGKVANQEIMSGEPILQRRIVGQLEGSVLANLITPDMRAVTVRVNDVIGVGGFLLPGNRVDVLATRLGRDRQADTAILLQDLKVLAVDQRAGPGEGDPVLVRAVTLEMKPEQATKLVSATEEGTIQLALRNPADSAIVAEKKEEKKPAPVVRRRAPRQPSGNAVTVIRGTAADKSRTRF